MDVKPILGQIAPDSDKLGLVDPDRLLTRVWSTPKQAIPLILINQVLLHRRQV